MARVHRAVFVSTFCLLVLAVVLFLSSRKYEDNNADDCPEKGDSLLTHSGRRHLMSTEEEDEVQDVDDFVQEIPKPELFYTISGSDFPYVEGGDELLYSWQLNHRVEEEHTNVIVSFEVNIPSSTFEVDSLNITLASHAFQLNETRIFPFLLDHSENDERVRFAVDLWDYLWVNLTRPWQRPDCWWTSDILCYSTDYAECVFLDQSPNQNWDPFFCRHFDISSCLPANETSECFYVSTTECLEQVYQSLGNPELARCPLLYNTSCIQVNDRGLYYGQYDWTRPPPDSTPVGYEKQLCGMTSDELWAFEEIVDGVTHIVEMFVSVDEAAGCTVLRMVPKEAPQILTTTYNPYQGMPTTDEYLLARQCLNVNTTGYYEPPLRPIVWKDFNITVQFTGIISNYIEVNQVFLSNLVANITQVSKPLYDQLRNISASLEYEVKLPWIGLSAIPTFSDGGQALKHEKLNHQLRIQLPHAISYGIKVTVKFQKISDEVKMTFHNETPTWHRYGNMVTLTSGFMVNETHDEYGPVTMHSMMEYMEAALRPSVRYAFHESQDVDGLIDTFEVEVPPVICVEDGAKDTFTVTFSSRVLATVVTGDVLKLPMAIEVVNSPRGAFSGGGAPRVTVVDQPFIPLVSSGGPSFHPDTGDDFVFMFNLTHLLDIPIFDIWMNISCLDLHTVPGTLIVGFMEPINVTTDSEYDLAAVAKTSLHFHLVQLTPDVNFCGNQTFNMWDNRMLTNQPTFCFIYLSYRKEGRDLVLPYEAARIEMFTLPGIAFGLYAKDLPTNASMYRMSVGSNATFVVNITFPETSTELDVTMMMPNPVLAVYSSLVTHIGSNLAFINATEYQVQPLDDDIGTWPMGSRTEVDLDFGIIVNSADNENDYQGDNLVFEFNCILRDTETVLKDTEHTLSVAVSHSGSQDLVQEQTISVIEPDVHLIFRLTNESIAGDPGDVFQYHLTINHTERSQTPAHHVVIRFYLPYMGVYQDFVPGNGSRVPRTSIQQDLGTIQADSILQLYLYKLDMEEIITGTFLIQISTKLTEGMALQASANYTMESFYQWGRHYPYSTVSENVINIRNATLYFLGTSQPQTGNVNVTIHEQVSYKLYIPLPPIATNLTLLLDLPYREKTIKKWKAEKLRSQVPKRPPVEQTFYDQGCIRKYTRQECYCYEEESNSSLVAIIDSDEEECRDVKMDNCTTITNETAPLILLNEGINVCNSTDSAVGMNCTNGGNCTLSPNTTSSLDSNTNCSASDNVTTRKEQLCDFSLSQRDGCALAVSESCENDPESAQKWPFVVYVMKRVCRNLSVADSNMYEGNMTNVSLGNTTIGHENCTDSVTHYGENLTTVTEAVTTSDSPDPSTLSTNSNFSDNHLNTSTESWREVCNETWVVDCHRFAADFCRIFSMRNCSEGLFLHENSSVEYTAWSERTCFCNDLPTPDSESRWSKSPYYICENRTEAELRWMRDDNLNKTELNFEICDEEESVMLAVADVISTEVTSTREGAVCYFVGGKRHNPFDAGVTYYAGYLPANDTDIGDSVSATVTMVILDDESISRGDVLSLNGTSIFSYVTKPVPPSDVFRDNCTCSRLLVDFFDPDSLIDCVCETVHLQNVNQSECNFTSIYQDEDTDHPFPFSCGCINYCHGNVSYFENPLKTFDVETFDPSLCDCPLLNGVILQQDPSFSDHVEACGRSNPRNYSCDHLNVTVTHRMLVMEQNCTCEVSAKNLTLCSCNHSSIVENVRAQFADEVYQFQNCNNGSRTGSEYHVSLNQANCICAQSMERNSTPAMEVTTLSSVNLTEFTTNFSSGNVTLFDKRYCASTPDLCTCNLSCSVHVEEESLSFGKSKPFLYHSVNYVDNFCQCEKVYGVARNVSEFLEWARAAAAVSNQTVTNATILRNISCENCSDSSNASRVSTNSPDYFLHCYCYNISRDLEDVPQDSCTELDTMEYFESECFVPPDNQTQFILDNWDYNATIIDQMITTINHEVVIVEPELQVTFTRHPLPAIVDRIDQVAFDFEVSHTSDSDSPAFNVYLELDAVNFTRNSASGELMPSEIYADQHCMIGGLCNEKYSNRKGLFHLPYFPKEPAGVVFFGTFNLSVGNHIDFVADSLLTARSYVTWDSCIVDFAGRPYGAINSSDMVQVDAPTISASLDFCTAYSFYSSGSTELPRVFSVGDYVRVKASLWVPEVTLQLKNLTISSDMMNVTIIYGQVFLSEQIWNRNDTASVYQELASDLFEGLLYDGLEYSQAKFQDGGVTVIPGIIINDADNIDDGEDFLNVTLTFRANDVASWYQGDETQFVISATYVSDYHRDLVMLQDDTVILTMVEPRLSLRVEILDHQFLLDQITDDAEYTCRTNECCQSVSCDVGKNCLTDLENINECSSAECSCYSGFVSHDGGGCSAVGRTSGDIITFGLTATHHPDFTGNAFDVVILVHSDLPSSLLPLAHFISHPFAPDYISMLSMPSLTQPSDNAFKLHINRFNHLRMCERFAVPFRLDPAIRVRAGESWSANASMTYYSAKPYGISTTLNTNSRFYQFEGENGFTFHAPAPSAEFYMMPTMETTSKLNFRVYSSSNQSHAVTVNVGGQTAVTFQINFVIPKILTDLSILLALPKGSGFQFHHGDLVFQGSRISIPEGNIKETTDLDGRPHVYISCPDVYSVPNTITKQRPFNGTIQQQFKSMLGDKQPYTSEPSCDNINSTVYENPLVFGCHNDSVHFFPVTMATENHPTNYNFSLSMTHQLCYQLCRDEDYFISGTKNGTDCYCGSFTTYHQYKDHAGTLQSYVNTTIDEPYTETVWSACNKTGVVWTNHTVSRNCLDEETYAECISSESEGCSNKMYSKCLDNFLFAVDCNEIASMKCNGSHDSSCETSEAQKCYNVLFTTCADYGKVSCELQVANGTIHESCQKNAQDVYRLGAMVSCQNRTHLECYRDNYDNCTLHRNASCSSVAAANCSDWSSGHSSEEECIQIIVSSCLGNTVEACSVLSEVKCVSTAEEMCLMKKPTATDVYVEECWDVLWNNCSTCMYAVFWDCHHIDGGTTSDCSMDAVHQCLHLCYQQNCTSVLHASYEENIYPTCYHQEVHPAEYIYLSNCSQDITRWRQVDVLLLEESPIPLSMCDTPCSGDDSLTCGGEEFIMMSGVLELSLVRQTCGDWYAGLYDPDEDTITWQFELAVSPLETKGITEVIQPHISYTHGPEKIPTLIPFAPFRLEAGRLELLMTVWTGGKLSGYKPGDFIEYYTEVRHHPGSTVTARDITVWWIFPSYIRFVNVTNHGHAHYEYHNMQPVMVKSTDPSQGITFNVPTLCNMDMVSYHFLVRLDPDGTLQSGDYNMVAFAEMDYFSWDIYNPHEGEYKYNVVSYYHDPEITRVEFKVETAPIPRPERDDIKLKMYTFLFDEQNNLFYVCFYNRTDNRKDGGCFVTGDLRDPAPDVFPSCVDYCNCTFQDGVKEEGNCTHVLPRPANCTCGCYPDCQEELLSCQDSCTTCLSCNHTLCSADCTMLYNNCTTACCEIDCTQALDGCIADCRSCDWLLGCTVDQCMTDCHRSHQSCHSNCHPPQIASCERNCTSDGEYCSIRCRDECQNFTSVAESAEGVESLKQCVSTCDQNCLAIEGNCTKECCTAKCDSEKEVCFMGCPKTCKKDAACTEHCYTECNVSHSDCFFDCDLASASCSGQCDLWEHVCVEDCPVECYKEICVQERIVTCKDIVDSSIDNVGHANATDSPKQNLNCTSDILASNPELETVDPTVTMETANQFVTGYVELNTTVATGVMNTSIQLNNTQKNNSSESSTNADDTVVGDNISPMYVTTHNTSLNNATVQSNRTEDEVFQFVNGSSNCTIISREVCHTEATTACGNTCREDCVDLGVLCRSDCCSLSCSTLLQDCQAMCLTNCSSDEPECHLFCRSACEDEYELCYSPCHVMKYHCKSDCHSDMTACLDQCAECHTEQRIVNHTVMEDSNVTQAVTAVTVNSTHTVTGITNFTELATEEGLPLLANRSHPIHGMNQSCPCNSSLDLNYTLDLNSSSIHEHYNCSCPSPSQSLQPQTVTDVCNKWNMSHCSSACNVTADLCYDNCPCEEGCHIEVATCWLTCKGCLAPCYDRCHGNCSDAASQCQETCENRIRRVSLNQCINSCSNSCVISCFHNQTLLANATCISECNKHRTRCTLECLTRYLIRCNDTFSENTSCSWNDSSSYTEDVGWLVPALTTPLTIFDNVTNVYLSSTVALLVNQTFSSDAVATSPAGGSTFVSSHNSTLTVNDTTIPDVASTVVYDPMIGGEDVDSSVRICINQCLSSNGFCFNQSEGNITFEYATVCSNRSDACISECSKDYAQVCCTAQCSPDRAVCSQSCTRCDSCLEGCKDACNDVEESCLSDCQTVDAQGDRTGSLHCDAYSYCVLGCNSTITQNCSLTCLREHVSSNCSSTVNCTELESCLTLSRRKRDSIGSSVTLSRVSSSLKDPVNLYRRRRSLDQNASLDENATSGNRSNESFDLCTFGQHRRNFTECVETCQNLSSGCYLDNETHCCSENGPCGKRDNGSLCMDACYSYVPMQIAECVADCQLTSTYCAMRCRNCSNSSECPAPCFEVCKFDRFVIKDNSECVDLCSMSMISSSCPSNCNSTCSDGVGSWDCTCTNLTMISAGNSCSDVLKTGNGSSGDSSGDCLVIYESCSCNCSCEKTEEYIVSWRRLHSSVGNILGYNTVNSTLYAVSRNGLAVMESVNFGESWRAISDGLWSDVQSSWWFSPAERMDQESLSLLNQTSSHWSFASDVWNVSYSASSVGVHYRHSSNWTELWETLVVWNCC